MSPPSGGILLRKKLRRQYRKLSDKKFNAAFARSMSRVEKGLSDGSINEVDICHYISFYMVIEAKYQSMPSFKHFLSKNGNLKEYGEPNTQPSINKNTLPAPDDRGGITNAIESLDDNGPIVIPKGLLEGFISGYGVGGVLSSNDVNYGAPKINIGNDFIDLDGDVVFEVENPVDLNSDGRSGKLMGEGLGLVKKWSEGSGGGVDLVDLVAVEEVSKELISDGSEWSVGVANYSSQSDPLVGGNEDELVVEEEITDDSARDVDATETNSGTDSGMPARDSEDMGGGTEVMCSSYTLRDVEGGADDGVFSEGTSGASIVAPSLVYTVVLFAILGCVCWCLGGAKGYGSLDSEDNGVVTLSTVSAGCTVLSNALDLLNHLPLVAQILSAVGIGCIGYLMVYVMFSRYIPTTLRLSVVKFKRTYRWLYEPSFRSLLATGAAFTIVSFVGETVQDSTQFKFWGIMLFSYCIYHSFEWIASFFKACTTWMTSWMVSCITWIGCRGAVVLLLLRIYPSMMPYLVPFELLVRLVGVDVLFGFYMRYDYKILAGIAAAALSYYFHDLPLLWVAASAVIFGGLDYFALVEPVLCSKACIYITSALIVVVVIDLWWKLIALILAVVAGIWGICALLPFILPPVLQGLMAIHGRIKSSSWFTTRTVVGTIILMKIVRVYGMSDVVEAASAVADAASAVGGAISSGGDTVGATLASLASGTAPSVAQGAAALGAVALLSGGGDSNGDEEDEPEVIYDVGEDNFEDPEAPEESTPRHPRDPVQGVLNSCRAQAYHMWKRFEIFLPTFFYMAGAFMKNLLPQLGDSRTAKVYYHRAKKKIGCAGNGIVRASFYNPLDFILTVFNLDLQSLENTELLSTFAINLCQWFCPISPSNLLQMTIQDAIDMEEMRYQEDNQKVYLPFVVCIFMYMISHDEEECMVLGGAIRVRSYLKRLCLLIVESGVQELLVSIGVELSKACQAHEWLQGSMSWVPASHNECADEVELFLKKVKELELA